MTTIARGRYGNAHTGKLEKLRQPQKNLMSGPYLPKTAAALEWALASLGVTVRQNMRSYAVEWCKDDEWLMLNGRAAARFRSDIETNFVVDGYRGLMPLKFGREAFNESMDSLLFDHEVDPFVEYLDTLPLPTGRRKLPGTIAHCFDVSSRI